MDKKSNTGSLNSGYLNSGDLNSGKFNSGDCNSGNFNSGNFNTGDLNSGNCNSGHYNSGDFNSGNLNSGFFNTNEPTVRMFNKDTHLKREDIDFPEYFYFSLTEWIDEENMTEQEKEDYPEYKTTKGYLKVYNYKEAWKNAFEEKCDKEQAEQTISLPNFDYDIFEEITGITKDMLDRKGGIKSSEVEIDLKLEDLSKETLINIINKLKEKEE